MNKRLSLITYKLVFALLGFSALVTEVAVLVERGQFEAGNFLSYFTVEANTIAVIAFIVGAFGLAVKSKEAWKDYLRGASTLFMAMTLIIFVVLLSGYDPRTLTAVPWDNTVLHYIIPVVTIIDWFIDPPKRKVEFKKALYWLTFPLLYLVYSLIRGSIVGWYPYPFVNPANGIASLFVVSIGITVLSVGLTWGVTKLSPLTRR